MSLKRYLLDYISLSLMALILCNGTAAKENDNVEHLDDISNYIVQDDIIVQSEKGVSLSILIVRPKSLASPLPVALSHTIYANENRSKDIEKALTAARKGYIGAVSYSRGKHLSTNKIVPYENEVVDVNTIIEWLGKQDWTDGRIAMYGGSYEGFTQWAATKNMHPSLKTIVPYVAAIPGQGLPMENNVFLNANYGWPFHVTNNKYKDDNIYTEKDRWNKMNLAWYKSGKAYRDLDSFDKRPNPWLQNWLSHPAYDSYWQSMVPFEEDYSQIHIPVLSITGYYDDGQISALHYLNEHYRFHPNPQHYLVIGPYDHWTAQTRPESTLRGITLDKAAQIDIPKLTFEWLDFILKGAPKPTLLKSKINYQVMGNNTWYHAKSMAALNDAKQTFYLTASPQDEVNILSRNISENKMYTKLKVDYRDRTKDNLYYPWPIESKDTGNDEGSIFISAPLEKSKVIAGQFSADLNIITNKRDLDISMVLYEKRPDGSYVHLSYFVGRASYAEDMSTRKLLTPGKIESIPISRTRMIGKKLSKGSQLVIKLNVNRNNSAQLNYGTGKDVSDESIADANTPLEIKWLNTSTIHLPIRDM